MFDKIENSWAKKSGNNSRTRCHRHLNIFVIGIATIGAISIVISADFELGNLDGSFGIVEYAPISRRNESRFTGDWCRYRFFFFVACGKGF